jgi:hypothetical protein
VPLGDEDDQFDAEEYERGFETGLPDDPEPDEVPDDPALDSDIQPDPYIDAIAEEHVQEFEPLLALPAAAECRCVMEHTPEDATTEIADCPAHRDDGEPPDPAEQAFQQARAYVIAVAEQEAYAVREAYALELEMATGWPAADDPAWPPWTPWCAGLEAEAETLALTR